MFELGNICELKKTIKITANDELFTRKEDKKLSMWILLMLFTQSFMNHYQNGIVE